VTFSQILMVGVFLVLVVAFLVAVRFLALTEQPPVPRAILSVRVNSSQSGNTDFDFLETMDDPIVVNCELLDSVLPIRSTTDTKS
jgi:hypothetical protein